jgi:hypothetical protein
MASLKSLERNDSSPTKEDAKERKKENNKCKNPETLEYALKQKKANSNGTKIRNWPNIK